MKGFFVAFDALPKESLMFLDLVQNTIFQKHNNNHNKALISKTYFPFVIPNIKVPFCDSGSFFGRGGLRSKYVFSILWCRVEKKATTNTNNTILFRKSRRWIKGYLYAWVFASEKRWIFMALGQSTLYSNVDCILNTAAAVTSSVRKIQINTKDRQCSQLWLFHDQSINNHRQKWLSILSQHSTVIFFFENWQVENTNFPTCFLTYIICILTESIMY